MFEFFGKYIRWSKNESTNKRIFVHFHFRNSTICIFSVRSGREKPGKIQNSSLFSGVGIDFDLPAKLSSRRRISLFISKFRGARVRCDDKARAAVLLLRRAFIHTQGSILLRAFERSKRALRNTASIDAGIFIFLVFVFSRYLFALLFRMVRLVLSPQCILFVAECWPPEPLERALGKVEGLG
jgi:hypothetical protein